MKGTRFNPFPGLRPFRMEEKYLFFGREEQTVEPLRQTRFLAVVGTSGSGKSSLVQAGLLPELYGGTMLQAGSHWQVVVLRPGGNPITHLAEALVAADLYDPDREDAAVEVRATLSRSGLGLLEAARQSDLKPGTNLLVVVDQFEEIFRFRRSGTANLEEAAAFVNLLLEASRQNEAAIYVALTMRSDYLGDCAEFPGLAEAVNEGEYLIPRLSREQKRVAITGPVKVGGGEMAPRLLQKLLNDVGDDPDHLPVLQHALMRTWDAWEGDHVEGEPIDLRHYRAVGEMAEALSRHADEVFAELPDDFHRTVARKLFKALTERSIDNRGIRRPATLRRLGAIADTDESTVRAVIDPFRRLGRTFLMPPEEVDLSPSTVIDISHESLMRVWTRLDRWVEEESQSARIYQRLADSAALYRAGKSALYHDPDLQIAESWRRDEHPNEAWANQYGGRLAEALAFLDESGHAAQAAEEAAESARRRELEQAQALAEAQRQRVAEQIVAGRKLKRLLAIAASIAVLAMIASFFAVVQRGRARKSEQAAQRSEQAAQGLASQLKVQLVRGDIRVALEKLQGGETPAALAHLARAIRTDPTISTEGFRALSIMGSGAMPTRHFAAITHEKPIDTFLYNPDAELLFTTSEEGREAALWDLNTGQRKFWFQGAYLVKPILGSDGSPVFSGGIPDSVAEELRDARWILHDADDRAEPGLDPRYYRKAIPLDEFGKIERAGILLRVDDEFTLSVNGTPLGDGKAWDYFHYADLTAQLAGKNSLVVEIEARNNTFLAGMVGTIVLTDGEGKRHLIPTDGSWQSSDQRDGPFADVEVLGRTTDWNEGKGRISMVAPGWSHDFKRLIFLALPKEHFQALDLTTGKLTGSGADASGLSGTPASEINEAVSPFDEQGDILAFTNRTGAVELWNLSTGKALCKPLRGRRSVSQWRFTPDGRRIVALGTDLAIYLWSVLDGSLVARMESPDHGANGISSLDGFTLSPDGSYLVASADSGKLLSIWNIADPQGSPPPDWLELPEDFAGLELVQFIADEPLMSAIYLRSVGAELHRWARTYELASRKLRAEIDCGRLSSPQMGRISAEPEASRIWMDGKDGERRSKPSTSRQAARGDFGLVWAILDRQVTVWDLRNGQQLTRITAPDFLHSANLAPDGQTLILGSLMPDAANSLAEGGTPKKLYLYDVFTGEQVAPAPILLADSCEVTISPDGETIVTIVEGDNKAQFWDLRTGRQVRSPVPGKAIEHCFFTQRGDRVIFFEAERTLRGETFLGLNLGRITLHQSVLRPAIPDALTGPGAWPSVHGLPGAHEWRTFDRPGSGGVGRVQTWDASSSTVINSINLEIEERTPNFTASWSRDGSRLVYLNRDAEILDLASGRPLGRVRMDYPLYVAAISANGKVVALGDEGGYVKIWREGHDELAFLPFANRDSISVAVLNADGSRVAIGDTNQRRFAIADTKTGELIFGPHTLPNPVSDALFLPDRSRIAVSAADYTVLVIDFTTGKTVQRIGVDEWSRDLELSPDGRTLAIGTGTGSSEAKVYLWNLVSEAMTVAPLKVSGSVPVNQVRFSEDGRLLAVGTGAFSSGATDSGSFQLWDVATGTALGEPVMRRAGVVSLAFQSGGSAVAIGWSDGLIQALLLPNTRDVPAWLPDVVESVGGVRLAPESGVLEPVSAANLDAARERFGNPGIPAADGWEAWTRWLFEDPVTRGISPGAKTTAADHTSRLRDTGTATDLREALRLMPNDAMTRAQLAVRLSEEAPPDKSPAHWQDTVERVSDQAIRLESENEVLWALRAEMFRGIGKPEKAESAALRARELLDSGASAANPNIDYELALALAAKGDASGADATFAEALSALESWTAEPRQRSGPLLGILNRQNPAVSPPNGPGREVRLPAPIPGTYQDFDTVLEGTLPAGWSVRNRSDGSTSAGSWSLNDHQSDAFKDWVVVSRDRFRGNSGYNAAPRLADPPDHLLNRTPTRLLDGNFILAQSDARRGVQIQELFTPDFDCGGQQGVHVAFHSAYTQNDDSIAALEFSTDRGSTWQPVVYRLEEKDVIRTASGAVDAVATMTAPQRDTPRFRDAGGLIRGECYGDFLGAAITPELAPFIESGPDDDHQRFHRIEVFRVPGADGQPQVRFRLAQAGSSSWYWIIDGFGLYAIPGSENPLQVEAVDPKAAERPAAAVPGPDRMIEIAEELLKKRSSGDALEALLLARRAAALLPGESRALDLQARALIAASAGLPSSPVAKEALAEGLGCVREAIALHPEIRPYWETLALIYQGMGRKKLGEERRDEAALYFEAADAVLGWLGRRDSALQQEIGEALISLGRMDVPRRLFPPDQGAVSNWRFLDDGSDEGHAWTLPDFDDAGWKVGQAPLGYGNDGEVTEVAGGPDNAKFITTYFRAEFTILDATAFHQLELQLLRDDGAVVYLNGEEIARSNMSTGEVLFDTVAAGVVGEDSDGQNKEGTTLTILAPSGALRSGRNVLAAEVHQVSPSSSDLSFDLRLTGLGLAADKLPPAVVLDQLETALEFPAEVRARLWTARAKLLADAGLAARAEEARQRALAIDPEDPTAWWLGARAAAAAGEWESASTAYRKAVTAALALAEHRTDSRRLFLPAGLRDFSTLVTHAPVGLAEAGLRRSREVDADRAWELRLLDRWLSETAPADPEVTQKRVAILTAAGEFTRAGELLEPLEQSFSSDLGLDAAGLRKRRELLALRENLLRATGHTQEAEAVKKAILSAPPRDPRLDPKLVDLTPYYNASLYDGRGWDRPPLNLGALPESFHGHNGIGFDIRGIIQLDGTDIWRKSTYPRQVQGIRIDSKAGAVHFLLATIWGGGTPPGAESGRIVFHFTDGSAATWPLIDQENISDFWIYAKHTIDPRKIAWTGLNTEGGTEHFQILHAVWTNPHPERTIATLDLISAMRPEAPFVVAITLE